jgi:hypothetical protein
MRGPSSGAKLFTPGLIGDGLLCLHQLAAFIKGKDRRQPPMTDLLIPMTDVEALKAAGIHYPATENAWRWCFRHRHDRGLDNAFKRNGRRIVVDVDAFKAALRNRVR